MEDIELMDHWCVNLMRASVDDVAIRSRKTALCLVCDTLVAPLNTNVYTMLEGSEVAVGVQQPEVLDTCHQVICKLAETEARSTQFRGVFDCEVDCGIVQLFLPCVETLYDRKDNITDVTIG